MTNGLTIKDSPIQGKGVFTLRPIKKDAVVFKFSNQKDYFHGENCNCRRCQYSIRISKDKAVTPRKNSFGWFLNHSCEANASLKGRNIIALRDIKTEEEITVDYSMHIPDKAWQMKCNCRSKNCRRTLRSIQYIPLRIFKIHQGKIAKFLETIYLKKPINS